jgi:ribosome maturation factor RimP
VSGTADRLRTVVEPYVAAEGIELDDLEVFGTGRGTIVRVTVDAPGSVDVDHLASLSRGLSRLLDQEDPFSGSYTLEVSTPGLERKLRTPRHYEKSIGREVKVKTHEPVDDARQHRGVLMAADDEGCVVEVAAGEARRIGYANVASARTVFEWVKSPKPGKRQ